MIWAFVVLVLLMIPILAIVLDSQIGQALADRLSADESAGGGPLTERVAELEAEVKYLSESVESLREESSFVRALIETTDRDTTIVGPDSPTTS